ncbi:PAS domain-containing protein [Sphingomonas sp. S2-65]|uniref:PAS domain-containing protein n=1 Tax=Sphingomonas sp. S2-65 TaxID=2903960 RepID=UPI001F1D9EB3|nr:PAS domain-containing protein [Sphingomonas sp. S2-65]UYY58086.1 PAS domain-containing protein [Sphingomonas sp. S2-65]
MLLVAATMLALSVLAVDSIAGFDVSVSILYLAVLVLIARAGTAREVSGGALACAMLAAASWYVVHGADPTVASVLRLAFACVAISVTGALLISRKKLETARRDLERSRAEVEYFANSVPQILWRANAQGEIQYFNARVSEVTGLNRESALDAQRYMEAIHPDDLASTAEAVAAAVAAQTTSSIYARLRHVDGSYRWMHLFDQPVRSPITGEIERFGGATDVHEEFESKQELIRLRSELEDTQRDLEHFADSVPQILWRSTREAHVDYYNKRYDEIVGRDRHDTIARQDWIEDFHPDDRDWYLERVRTSFEAGTELQAVFRLRHADGSYRWMSLVGRPVRSEDGEVLRYYGGVSDVHEDVLARQELQRLRGELEQSQAELQNFTDSVPQILWRASPEGPVEYFNRRYTDLTGQSVEDAIAKESWRETIHPEDREQAFAALVKSRTGEGPLRCKFRMLHADGSYRWMSLYALPVFDADGRMTGRYGGTVDIHDEVLASEQISLLNATLEARVEERTADLLRTEARYASLFDVSNITFAEMDFSATEPLLDELREKGVTDLRAFMTENPDVFARCLALIRTTRVNEALARMMGYADVAELVSNPPAQNADDGPQVLLRQLEMYYYGIDHIDGRTVLMGKNGVRIPVYFTVNRLADGLHLSSHVDLRAQERIEELRLAAKEEFARANRVATVGAFSASIAHELNQPIASMVMDAQTALRWLQREEPDIGSAERSLERLTRTTQRVAGIVKRTRDSIVAGTRVAKPVDLCALAAETRDLLERDMRVAEAALEIDCEDGLPLVSGDPVDLQQIFVNLVSNAADAMRDQPGERIISLSLVRAEDGVRVRVSDTGPGIPEGEFEKLFQPFYTTKPTGIGMGLQICRSAVEALGGELAAMNRPEGGALFTFTLPSLEAGSPRG